MSISRWKWIREVIVASTSKTWNMYFVSSTLIDLGSWPIMTGRYKHREHSSWNSTGEVAFGNINTFHAFAHLSTNFASTNCVLPSATCSSRSWASRKGRTDRAAILHGQYCSEAWITPLCKNSAQEGDAKTKAQPLFVASSWPVMEIEAFPSEFNTTNGYNFFATAPSFPFIKNGQVG